MEEVYCELKYSGAAEAFLAAAVGGTLAIVVFVPFPDALRALLFAAVIALAFHARAKLRAVRGLRIDCERGIDLEHAAGRTRGRVVDGCFVAPWLTIVRWRPEGAWLDRTVVLLPGMAPQDAMRKIRVILRWA